MRLSSHVVLLILAAATEATNAAAQAPPPAGAAPQPPAPPASAAPAPPAPSTAPAPPPAPSAAAPATPPAAPSASALAEPPPATPPAGATGAPAPASPLAPILDKVSADAFVDGYFSFNSNAPKPAANSSLYGPSTNNMGLPASAGGFYAASGGNSYRAFDTAQGFALNWVGLNASYAADPIGGTVSLRMGPGATIYHAGTSDETAGLQFVKQAYVTWKPADKVTLDFGKWDQPFGSEVADSQLNMNYTRSVLFWYAQPLWFTGLRADYALSDSFDAKIFMANGWNETLKLNRSYSFRSAGRSASLRMRPLSTSATSAALSRRTSPFPLPAPWPRSRTRTTTGGISSTSWRTSTRPRRCASSSTATTAPRPLRAEPAHAR